MLAARYQHDLVVLIRAALDDRRLSLKDHAAHEGFDYTRTTRMLRGEIVMKLEDIAAQHRTLGIAYPV
ncbi:hypothetical protein ASF30_13825 [Leifsonia sp. Leaf264]|nr:hypothetical protein ASF30_13825 [Leifsonia sp. Leaf264]